MQKRSGLRAFPFLGRHRFNGETETDRLPRFAVSATEDLAEGGPEIVHEAPDRARLALAEALSASQPVTVRDRFAGRYDILETLIAAIEQQRAHIVVYGERGIGKTSIIHMFSEAAREARYVVLYSSCGVAATFDNIFRSFAAQLPLLYHAKVPPTASEDEHQRTFADLLGDSPVDARQLAELFGEVVGTRVIIVLDEYDRIADVTFRREVAELIKNLSDRAARVQLLLAGVASNLEELIGFTPSIRRNIVGLPVGPMSEPEMREILAIAEGATGLTFPEDSSALIVTMAGGSPYMTRLLALRAASRTLDEERDTVSPDDVIAGTESVLAEWNSGLPRRTQALLRHPDVRTAWPTLIAAARASGTPDGWFTADDVASELGDDVKVDQVVKTLDSFIGPIDIFDRVEAQPADLGREPRFRFRAQGVAQLLALSAALARAGR
ncbi:MAG: AAA family ATPase [Thermaurantiacus sp.]